MSKYHNFMQRPLSRREMLTLCKGGFGSLAFMSLFGLTTFSCNRSKTLMAQLEGSFSPTSGNMTRGCRYGIARTQNQIANESNSLFSDFQVELLNTISSVLKD